MDSSPSSEKPVKQPSESRVLTQPMPSGVIPLELLSKPATAAEYAALLDLALATMKKINAQLACIEGQLEVNRILRGAVRAAPTPGQKAI